ncbi:hypothetical protein PSPO01_11721 [Paraphaeosphaeria sporulosa]
MVASPYESHRDIHWDFRVVNKKELCFPNFPSSYVELRRLHSLLIDVLIQTAINGLGVAITPKPYDDFEQSPYAGLPSSSIDAAWHYLLEPTTIRVTPGELNRSNQTSVPLPGGGYMAWLGVFHELHCIKMVRQWVYRDHYYPNITEDEFEESSIHADHCLDILRSAALCHGDTTLTTFGWTNKSKPQLNTRPINHKCVDWKQLVVSVEDRVVQREEMEAMVNPNLQ